MRLPWLSLQGSGNKDSTCTLNFFPGCGQVAVRHTKPNYNPLSNIRYKFLQSTVIFDFVVVDRLQSTSLNHHNPPRLWVGIEVRNWMDLFGIGAKGECLHKAWRRSNWGDWESLSGGSYIIQLNAVAFGDNLEVFILGLDYTTGPMFHLHWNGSYWGSGPIDPWRGSQVHRICAIVQNPMHIDVFTLRWNNQLIHNVWDGSKWGAGEALGELALVEISACRRTSTTMELFGKDLEGQCWQRTWNGSAWEEWKSVEGRPYRTMSSIALSPQRFDVVGITISPTMTWHYYWNV